MKVWKAASQRAREEVRDMQKMKDPALDKTPMGPWDYRFYAEKVRRAKYDFDGEAVRPYLQLNNIRDAMFWSAKALYGLVFAPIASVPTFHPDVEVYEVMREGKLAGLWYFDPSAREGKHSGAWMSEYRSQENIDGPVAPIVSNNANFVRGADNTPVLISWDDAVTMFHEFGHALHGLCSQVRYPSLSGTRVSRDFVEFPSQLNEHWLDTPEVLNNFAKHCETGEPLGQALMDKIHAAKTFNQGFHTVEYLAAAIYDLKIHSVDSDAPIDPIAFEQEVMQEIDCPSEIVMRHRPTQFAHIFSGDGYSAGYYSYIWADTLTADAAEAFSEAGGFFDAVTAKRLFDTVLSVGNAVPPEKSFSNFRGRGVDTGALMRDRGLVC
jgi:peptidyl-dipeptidase Dcp